MGSRGWLGVVEFFRVAVGVAVFGLHPLRGQLGCVGVHLLQQFLGALLQGYQTPPPGVFG